MKFLYISILLIGVCWADDRIVFRDDDQPAAPPAFKNRIALENNLSPYVLVAAEKITKFSFNLDEVLQKNSENDEDNILFSPVSLTYLLTMALAGSNGQTFDEIVKVMGFEPSKPIREKSEAIHFIYSQLFSKILDAQKQENGPKTELATSMFVQDGYPIGQEFRALIEVLYKSDIINVEYSDGQKAFETINNWVSEKTKGNIKTLFDQAPDSDTRIVLASALYFNGQWAMEFNPENTVKSIFTVNPGNKVLFDSMFNNNNYSFCEDTKLGVRLVGIPYEGQDTVMWAFLPIAEGTQAVKDLKARLTPEIVDELISKANSELLSIVFPKMDLTGNLNLNEALKTMGVTSMFGPEADFSVLSPGNGESTQTVRRDRSQAYRSTFGIDELKNSGDLSRPDLNVDNVVHKVTMKVNEKGTEAAAASGMDLGNRFGDDSRHVYFNKPFLFLIRNEQTKAIWFWGTINKPTPNEEFKQ
ncbi:hypothetical protein TKK_0015122 [Trichogramma kaykai]|uniref:Serpin domain-containing protein n=1 Tax=Trichogramma kaykai TaxID=54128 RepID=A0ABD2WAG0_9HYME